MMNKNSIFTAASVSLPDYPANDSRWSAWAVIACDQFTSEEEYWQEAEKFRAGVPSTLDLFLPEVYLETEKADAHRVRIADSMRKADEFLTVSDECMIYLERRIPDGRVRRGLVGKIDLEAYDFKKGSTPAVRATEATVLERIPPRVAIRSAAAYELPHVMVLINDTEGMMDALCRGKDDFRCIYDFDLMLGGGHAAGYAITGDALAQVQQMISAYENARADGLVYAVGDGNHSLASAKAHYENIKKELGDAAADHPARYALVELVALEDEALDFEPIYRVVECDTFAFLAAIDSVTTEEKGAQTVTVVSAQGEKTVSFAAPTHALTVGTLQEFIDAYAAEHPGTKCDYIHDESSLIALAKREGSVGFLFDGMQKDELFPYVRDYGTLPRKTFSMGGARSKRYYIEARKIVK